MTAIVELDERSILSLVLCAFTASEIESAYDLTEIGRMPTPFPEALAMVQLRYDEWCSLEFPYDVFPDGWQASLQA